MARVGVLLCGCGFYDGTDLDEAVLTLLALDRAKVRAECIAPGLLTSETIDHSTGTLVEGADRSVLAESARIARGRIVPIQEARPGLLSALVIPGGSGVVRTLMRGTTERGSKREADPEAAGLIKAMLARKKPVGAISLAGSLVATAMGLPLVEDPFSTPASAIVVDEDRKIVWTPGHLSSDSLAEIGIGIERMVAEVLKRTAHELPVLR